MSRTVLLDTGPLGLLASPPGKKEAAACRQWLASLQMAGGRIIVPEITDYEVRRELLRARKIKSVARLESLAGQLELPSTHHSGCAPRC